MKERTQQHGLRSPLVRTAPLVAGFLAYIAAHSVGLATLSNPLYPLYFVPVLLAAWSRGLLCGLLTAALSLPLHVASCLILGLDPAERLLNADYAALSFGYLAVAAVIGRLYTVTRQLGEEVRRRRETEAALEESEKRFSLFMDNLPAQVFINDKNHTALYLNREHQRVYRSGSSVGKHISAFLGPEESERAEELNERALQEGLQIFETNATDSYGNERYYQTYLFPIPRKGEDPLLGGISIDMTRWRDAQRELQEASEEKELLLREIHHRVRNNLSVINGLLRLRKTRIDDPGAHQLCLEIEQRIAAISLVHEKLYRSDDLKRIDLDTYVAELGRYLLATLLEDPDLIELNVGPSGFAFSVETLVPLGIVLTELLTNALKYAFPDDRGGRIDVAAYYQDEGYRVTVADNGVGMPKDFDPMEDGSLGYQLIYALTDQIGGSVSVADRNGTTVSIFLPAKSKE